MWKHVLETQIGNSVNLTILGKPNIMLDCPLDVDVYVLLLSNEPVQ